MGRRVWREEHVLLEPLGEWRQSLPSHLPFPLSVTARSHTPVPTPQTPCCSSWVTGTPPFGYILWLLFSPVFLGLLPSASWPHTLSCLGGGSELCPGFFVSPSNCPLSSLISPRLQVLSLSWCCPSHFGVHLSPWVLWPGPGQAPLTGLNACPQVTPTSRAQDWPPVPQRCVPPSSLVPGCQPHPHSAQARNPKCQLWFLLSPYMIQSVWAPGHLSGLRPHARLSLPWGVWCRPHFVPHPLAVGACGCCSFCLIVIPHPQVRVGPSAPQILPTRSVPLSCTVGYLTLYVRVGIHFLSRTQPQWLSNGCREHWDERGSEESPPSVEGAQSLFLSTSPMPDVYTPSFAVTIVDCISVYQLFQFPSSQLRALQEDCTFLLGRVQESHMTHLGQWSQGRGGACRCWAEVL